MTFRTSGRALRIFEGNRLVASIDPGGPQMAALLREIAAAHSAPPDPPLR